MIPAKTQINGQDAEWSALIWQLWYTFADHADPKWTNVTVSTANYYTPRPYVDEYNTGSTQAGFCYVLNPGQRVIVTSWHQAHDGCLVPEHYAEKILAEKS
jgi:hypothetical protein